MVDRMADPMGSVTHDVVVHGGNLHEAARALRHSVSPNGSTCRRVSIRTAIRCRRFPPMPGAACPMKATGSPPAPHAITARRTRRTCCPSRAARRRFARCPRCCRVRRSASRRSRTANMRPRSQRAGHRVAPLDVHSGSLPDTLTHVVVVNPNNPTADASERRRCCCTGMHNCAKRGGTLIVDEAFADTMPGASLAASTASRRPDRVALAGQVLRPRRRARGFRARRAPALLDALRRALGAWTVSGPARHAVQAAFDDDAWQRRHAHAARWRKRRAWSACCVRMVSQRAARRSSRGPTTHAPPPCMKRLARRGVWTRLFASSGSVRFGLPASDDEWTRFDESLRAAMHASTLRGSLIRMTDEPVM